MTQTQVTDNDDEDNSNASNENDIDMSDGGDDNDDANKMHVKWADLLAEVNDEDDDRTVLYDKNENEIEIDLTIDVPTDNHDDELLGFQERPDGIR